jgi:hypothetical protein
VAGSKPILSFTTLLGLDLLKFFSRGVAQAGARAAATVRRELGDTGFRRVDAARNGALPVLYVNSRIVSREDFETVLRSELSLRPPTWPVYFEGDPGMPWEYAVKTIDAIRGLYAEVVLLAATTTPHQGRSGSD